MKKFLTLILATALCAMQAAADPGLGSALRYLYPAADLSRDYLVVQLPGQSPFVQRWDAVSLGPQPSQEQIAAAVAHLVAVDAMRADLRAAYAALPAGVQVFYRNTFAEAQIHFTAGNVAAGREVIATTPAATPEIAAAQTAMLAIIDAAFP